MTIEITSRICYPNGSNSSSLCKFCMDSEYLHLYVFTAFVYVYIVQQYTVAGVVFDNVQVRQQYQLYSLDGAVLYCSASYYIIIFFKCPREYKARGLKTIIIIFFLPSVSMIPRDFGKKLSEIQNVGVTITPGSSRG